VKRSSRSYQTDALTLCQMLALIDAGEGFEARAGYASGYRQEDVRESTNGESIVWWAWRRLGSEALERGAHSSSGQESEGEVA
jgi:hypothetical protein